MIEPLQPWHLISVVMRARPEDLEDIALIDGMDRQEWACRMALQQGLSYAVTEASGRPVACFGFIDETKGVCRAWLVATPEWCSHVKSVARTFKLVAKEGGYRRIQAMVQPGRPGVEKFLRWLGFTRDGSMPKVRADGGSMDLYSYT